MPLILLFLYKFSETSTDFMLLFFISGIVAEKDGSKEQKPIKVSNSLFILSTGEQKVDSKSKRKVYLSRWTREEQVWKTGVSGLSQWWPEAPRRPALPPPGFRY